MFERQQWLALCILAITGLARADTTEAPLRLRCSKSGHLLSALNDSAEPTQDARRADRAHRLIARVGED